MAEIKATQVKRHELADELLTNIKSNVEILSPIAASFAKSEPEFIYRFYHQSMKVFGYGELIRYSVEFFQSVSPQSRPLNGWFSTIASAGLSKEFRDSTNENWLEETRPLLEAFWHTKYFVNQMSSVADSLQDAPEILPYDWAAVLYLYDLR